MHPHLAAGLPSPASPSDGSHAVDISPHSMLWLVGTCSARGNLHLQEFWQCCFKQMHKCSACGNLHLQEMLAMLTQPHLRTLCWTCYLRGAFLCFLGHFLLQLLGLRPFRHWYTPLHTCCPYLLPCSRMFQAWAWHSGGQGAACKNSCVVLVQSCDAAQKLSGSIVDVGMAAVR